MKNICRVLAVCVCAIGFTSTSYANLIMNGDFETPDISGRFLTLTSEPLGFGWTIEGSGGFGVDIVNTEWQGISGTSNSDGIDQSVDIDFASTLTQSFSTTPGETYFLEFAYSHNFNRGASTGNVDITGVGNLFSTTLTHDIQNSQQDMQWIFFRDSFIADGTSTTLTFTGEFDNNVFGFAVDDVSVSTVPLPAGIYLFFSSIMLLAFKVRGRK